MDIDDLARRIFDLDDPDDDLLPLQRLLDEVAVPDAEQIELLHAVRDSARGSDDRVWRAILVAARVAPAPLAVCAHVYGRRLNATDDYDRSLPWLRIARAAYLWAADYHGAARAAGNLADSLLALAQFGPALASGREAAALYAALDPESEQRRAQYATEHGKVLLTIANIFTEQRRAGEALDTYALAEVRLRSAADHSDDASLALVDVQVSRGRIYEEQLDDFDMARQQYLLAERELSELRERLPAGRTNGVDFRIVLNHAVMDLRLGHYTNALALLDRASRLIFDHDDQGYGLIWRYYGYLALQLDDMAEAFYWLSRAREHARQHGDKQTEAEAALFLGLIPQAASSEDPLDVLAEAEQAFAQLDIPFMVAIAAAERAGVAYALGDAQASALYLRARTLLDVQALGRRLDLEARRAIYDKNVSIADVRIVIEQLQARGDHRACADVLTALGQRLEESGERVAAHQAYHEAMHAIAEAHGTLRLSSQSIRFLARRRLPYERAFELVAVQAPAEAFAISERARAQTLLSELINTSGLQQLLRRADDRLQAMQLSIERAQARAAFISARPTHGGDAEEPELQRRERLREERDFLRELDRQAADSDEIAWVRARTIETHDVQPQLGADTAVICYLWVRSRSEAKRDLWAIMLTAHKPPRAMRVASGAHLDFFLKLWRTTALETCSREQADTLLQRMYDCMLKPLADVLARYSQLIIVADDQLPLLPLHAALTPERRYLIQTHDISYAPSVSVLLHCRQRELARQPGSRAVLAGWEAVGDSFLPFARQELDMLSRLLGTHSIHDVGDVAGLLSDMAHARFVHLTCHGVFPLNTQPSQDMDLRSRFAHLKLGHQANLYAYDLYGTRLVADLMVLSACDSGKHGAGLQGLVSASLVAGASAVIASMWRVQDDAAVELMPILYTALVQQRATRAGALRAAQCGLIESADRHPNAWAPFFLVGVPGSLPSLSHTPPLDSQIIKL